MAQVDTSIYGNFLRPVKSVQEYDQEAQAAEGNKLGLLLQRGQYDAQQRGVADDQAYREAAKGFGADTSANYQNLLKAGLPTQAASYQKTALDGLKTRSDIDESKAKALNFDSEVKKRDFEVKQSQTLQHLQQVGGIRSVQDAHAWIDAADAAGELPPGRAPQVKQALATGQLDLNQWKNDVQNGGLTLMQQRDNEFKAAEQAQTKLHQGNQDRVAQGQLGVAQGQLGVARQRLTLDQQAPKGQYDPERGVLVDPRTGEARPVTMGGKPLAPKAKSGPMSVTLQKELIESDDNVQQSASAISALKKAKTINDAAYSGYGASTRAALMSNLGGSKSADATVELDNLIGNQALSSLKTIFGGNPTEGERAILLDLQASSSKTPSQRTAIIDRAIKAAEVRAKYASGKAQSIRSGKYLTEGAPTPDASGGDIHSQADAILRGGK